MLIHFVGSVLSIEEDLPYFRRIVKAIHDNGHILTRDWVEPAYKTWQSSKTFKDLDWRGIYSQNMEALTRADIVIVDTTTKSFSVGYQTAIALQQKKPTLLLVRSDQGDGLFASGMDEDLLVYKSYDDKNLEKILAVFIQENTIETKDMRFNFFIDRPIYNYLRWAAHKTGKTKAEILRDLVVREIDKETKPSA